MDFNVRDQAQWNRLFEEIPAEWTQAGPSLPMVECAEFLKPRNVSSVLDAGCGIGRWALYLSQQGFEVKGFDFSENAVRFAEDWTLGQNQLVELEVAPLTAPPFAGEIFDAVIAALVLDSLSRREMMMAIDALSLRLRRGGIFYALFNPYPPPVSDGTNPTDGITFTPYKDSELRMSFPGYRLLEMRSYPQGLRGLWFRKE